MKKTEEPKPQSMNYNDRQDGYGFGEAESMDTEKDYEKDPHYTKHCIDLGEGYRQHKNEPYTKDEYGLRNQYGPVDQYVFRTHHLVGRGEKKKDPPEEKKVEDKTQEKEVNQEEDQL